MNDDTDPVEDEDEDEYEPVVLTSNDVLVWPPWPPYTSTDVPAHVKFKLRRNDDR